MLDWNGCMTAGRFGFQTGETLRSTPEHTERMTDLWNRRSGVKRTIRLLIAFLQSDAETPEAAAEKFAKKLLDIPENVDLFAETPEENRTMDAEIGDGIEGV